METNEIMSLIPSLFAGVVLGTIFFGGLWFTVRIGLRSKKSGLIFVGSFILRTAIVLLGFYFMGDGNWKKILVCLAGFLIARLVISILTRKVGKPNASLAEDYRQ